MGRLGLTPGAYVPGLLQDLDIGPGLRGQLRAFLEEDLPSSPAEVPGESGAELRKCEERLMETQARILKSRKVNEDRLYSQRRNDPVPVVRMAQEILTQQALQAGLAFDGGGKMVLAEFPDPSCCDHLQPLLEWSQPERKDKEKAHENEWQPFERKVKFIVQPPEILFRSFVLGKTFHAQLRVTNAGYHSASFRVRGPKYSTIFAVTNRLYKGQVLAPGLSVVMDVTFTCQDKEDHFDSIEVHASDCHLLVPIWAKQDPPILMTPKYSMTLKISQSMDFSEGSLVEFEKCFVDDLKVVEMRLVNEGPLARFFFIGETDWMSQSIKAIIKDYTICVEQFYLKPAYFALEKGQSVVMEVGFRPNCEGSHVAKVYVLCDNVTLRSLDLLGEAVSYTPGLLQFQGLEKTYDIMIEDDPVAGYSLYVGEIYKNLTGERFFHVKNKSLVSLELSWGEVEGGGKLEILPAEAVISPGLYMDFLATSNTTDLPPGRHRAIFSVYANNIPSAAFPDKYKEDKIILVDSERASVRLGTLELWMDVVEPTVLLKETYIHLLLNQQETCTTALFVSNLNETEVTVIWEIDEVGDDSSVSVWPGEFTIPPIATKKFSVSVTSGTLPSYCWFLMGRLKNYDDIKFEVLMTAEVEASFKEQGGHMLLNPGILRVGQQYIATVNLQLLQRDIIEEVSYNLVAVECGQQKYFVELVSDHQELCASLACSKFFLPKLYVGQQAEVCLVLQNHKLLETRFRLAHWFGEDADSVLVSYSPDSGSLAPGQHLIITLTITALLTGFVSDVFVPCYVEGGGKPLIVQLLGMVKEREVKISWPAEGQLMIVTWPQEECNEDVQPPSPCLSTAQNESGFLWSPPGELSLPPSVGSKGVEEDGVEENSLASSSLGTIPYEKWPIVGGRYYGALFQDKDLERDFNTPWTCESLNKKFKTLSMQEKHDTFSSLSKSALTFHVNLFNESTLAIELFNSTLTTCKYKAQVKFFSVNKDPEKVDPISAAMLQVYGRKHIDVESPELVKRKWKNLIRDKLGLGIKIKNRCGEIKGNERIGVEVTVYSIAWGLYLDSIIIEFDGLPSFHIPVVVRSTGHPAYLTFTNSILRFPSVMPNSLTKKTVYVKNQCFLPVKVVWGTYSESGLQLTPDFSVQIEFHPEEDADFCKIHLTHYVGLPNRLYYRIEPSVVHIAGFGKVPVDIILDTSMYNTDPSGLVRTLKATAVGTVYVQRNDDICEEDVACFRPDGYGIDQIILQLETKMEVPRIRLINSSRKDLYFQVRTRDIYCSPSKCYRERRQYTFENSAERKVFLKLLSSCPFTLTKLLTQDGELPLLQEIVLGKHKILQVEIELVLTESGMLDECEDGCNYLDYPGLIRRELVCRERTYSENVFPFYLEILKPKLEISTNPLNFGLVVIEETASRFVTITSLHGDEPFVVNYHDPGNIFKITPLSGTFRAGNETSLAVKFCPRECRGYCVKVRVVSTTPGQDVVLLLKGRGVGELADLDEEEGDFLGFDCSYQGESTTSSPPVTPELE